MGGVKFDPTVNLGHIITAVVFLVTATFGWATLDSRQARLEERMLRLEAARDRGERDTLATAGTMATVAAQVAAIQRTVNRIEGVLDRPPQNQGGPR